MTGRRFALVAGGGTAGHVLPALAVARALEARRGPGSVELVGSRRGLEASLLADVDLPRTLLPGRGIARRLDPASLLANAAAVAGLLRACVLALLLVARRRPAVVVAVGGYASVPAALAARLLAVPLVLVNVDAVPGAANRLLGRFARASAVAYPDTPLPRAVLTGAPVRPEVVEAAVAGRAGPEARAEARTQARQRLGLPRDSLVVAAFGGSLGARRINEAVLGLARLWVDRTDRALYHVVGRRDAAWAGEQDAPGAPRYVQVPYEDRMDLLYQAADLAVCRAGAMTVAELAVIGLPAVLVPLPVAPGDHQTANAGALVRAGAALLLLDGDCTPSGLAAAVDAMASDPATLPAMAEAGRSLGRPTAAAAVAALAEAQARPRQFPAPVPGPTFRSGPSGVGSGGSPVVVGER